MSRRPRQHSWRPVRAIRLVDAENVAGAGRLTPGDLARGRHRLDTVAPAGHDDHTVVAADHINALQTGLTWPHGQLLIGRGGDGADIALLEWAATADIPARFDSLIIASGDFAFVSLAAIVRSAGVPVTVAAWRNSCSRVLASVATDVVWLDPTSPAPAPATTEVLDAA